jgi:hypothetical protein
MCWQGDVKLIVMPDDVKSRIDALWPKLGF